LKTAEVHQKAEPWRVRVHAIRFLKSRSILGLITHLIFCAIISAMVAWGFYASSLSWFKEHKSEEKVTALRLVDAFVTHYSAIRSQLGADAPVPASFRAHSIEMFSRGSDADFSLRWVGREGMAIKTPPADAEMAATIEAFAANPEAKPISKFLTLDGRLTFRTIYPSVAREQSCVAQSIMANAIRVIPFISASLNLAKNRTSTSKRIAWEAGQLLGFGRSFALVGRCRRKVRSTFNTGSAVQGLPPPLRATSGQTS
jgi:hypothetical protein